MEQAIRFDVQIQKVDPAPTVGGYIKRADCGSPRLDSTPTFPLAPSGFSHFPEQEIGQEPFIRVMRCMCPRRLSNRNLWNNGRCCREAAYGVFTTQILQFLSRGSP
jgi:hypothetical protein